MIRLDVLGTFVWGIGPDCAGSFTELAGPDWGYALGERFGELDLRSVQPLQDPNELGYPAAVLFRAQ